MQHLPGQHRPLWTIDVAPDAYPELQQDITVDVAVVGGGITGVTTALLCKDAGLTVALLEADRIGSGTTGGTTGKVTSQHGLFYASAVDDLGEATARTYGEANQAALPTLDQLSERHGVDAVASRLASYVYTEDPARVPDLRAEAEVAGRLGLPASFVDTVDLPFEVAGAVRFDDQMQIHPTRLVHGFARAVDGGGSTVHEHSRVVNISEKGDVVEVTTSQATVRARHVIVATLLPILDRGFEFARTRPVRAYGIAVEVDGDLPGSMYISAESPKRSLRRYHGDEGDYLVVVGENHETGHGEHLADHYTALIDFANEHFPVRSVAYRWSAQDFTPVDGMPYVGPLRFADHIQIATGFNKWGLSNGVVAASIMSDHVLERPNPWAEVFDANRGHALGRYADLVKDNLQVAKRFLGDRIEVPIGVSPSEIPPGDGRVIRVGGRPIAVHRTAAGQLQAVDATCTHLGCLVAWNDAETSWDCPCHGSRFAPTGEVLTGPAIAPLQPADDDLTDA